MKIEKCLVLIILIVFTSCNNNYKPVVGDLKCEGLQNPAAIDKTTPRFSWKIKSKKNGTSQSAFRILVASDMKLLKSNKADLWDSGITGSGSQIWVGYEGKALKPGWHAYWKVRVWDEKGNVSEWSRPAEFGIGLLNPDDWQACYIAFNTENGYCECPQLYKSFELKETGEKLFLHVNSLGYHEVYINGKKAGDGVLTPAVSQFDKRSLVNTYDVSSLVKKGKNDLIIWLGSGWYTEGLPGVANNGPVVKAQLEKTGKNKREIILATDSTWMGRRSSYTRHGNWQPYGFGGEITDGKLAKGDLTVDDNHERSWQSVSVISIPDHHVSPQMVEQNKIDETILPSEILQTGKDTFLIDMGKNLTGWIEIHFPELSESQEIKMEYCDHLSDDGKVTDIYQFDKYIASGKGSEFFKNKFNYHAFRYIRITGLNEMPKKESVRAFLIHTGYGPASGFECSDPDLNRIHDMLLYTFRCLSLGGDLVDCPHIERLGYGGDGNASTLTAQTMFDLGPLYNNWLQAWADVIRDDGGMPHTAPNPYTAGGGPYWCGFIITASWNTFLDYGDTLLLEKYYPVMQKWLEYAEKYKVDGLLKRWPDTDYRGWYLGDWATPEGIDKSAPVSIDVVNNSFLAVCYDDMQKIARLLRKDKDAAFYGLLKEQLRGKIHDIYFNVSNNTYGTGTQIDIAFPMIAGVVPQNLHEKVKESFYQETEINRNGHIACGLVGIPVVTEWVIKENAADLMYSMLKKRDYPGYLYMIDNNATTTWEQWNGERSRIHNCYNGIGSWFYRAVGGIQPADDAPAYRKVRIQPQIPHGVTWAKTFKETPWGRLAVNWKLSDGMMNMMLEIPVGVEAEVIFPENTKEYFLNGAKYDLNNDSPMIVCLQSGNYSIGYEKK